MKPREVTLDEARRRVGTVMHVDPEWWAWTPGDIRWLTAQWRRAHTVSKPPTTPPRPAPARPLGPVVAGLHWWAFDSPRILRVMTAFVVLFAYSFGWGWASG